MKHLLVYAVIFIAYMVIFATYQQRFAAWFWGVP